MAKQIPQPRTRCALALLVAASLLGASAPSSAQNVPIPKPAPKARAGAQEGERVTAIGE